MSNTDYFKGFHKMCYGYSIEVFKKISENIEGCNIDPLLKKLEEIHKYLYSNEISDYKTVNDTYNSVKEYGSYSKYLNHTLLKLYKREDLINKFLSDKSLDQYVYYIKDSNTRVEKSEFNDISIDYNDSKDVLKENLKNLLSKYKDILLYFSYWYIVLNDDDYAEIRLLNFKDKNNIKISPSLLEILKSYCRFTDVGGEYSRALHSVRSGVKRLPISEFLKENGLSSYSDSTEKSIEIYNDFLSLLK